MTSDTKGPIGFFIFFALLFFVPFSVLVSHDSESTVGIILMYAILGAIIAAGGGILAYYLNVTRDKRM